MKVLPNSFKNFTDKNQYVNKYDTTKDKKKNLESNTLRGYLLNNNIKKDSKDVLSDLDKVSNGLLITDIKPIETNFDKKEENFNSAKILKPLAFLSSATIIGVVLISMLLKGYSKKLLNKADLIQPEDLARNMNIVEEPEFAMFRALRDPNKKNILGLLGVGLMSGFTLGAKNFVDGYKEIWIKKQECDINRNFQKELIDVETKEFSGKLNVVNSILKNSSDYFKEIFSKKETAIPFKGKKDENKTQNKNQTLKKGMLLAGGILASVALAFFTFKNYQKTINNLDKYEEKFKNKLIDSDKLEIFSIEDKKEALKRLKEVLISTKASNKTIEEDVRKIKNITPQEIEQFIQEIKDAHIFSNADKAIYGTSGKIQYYCYINDNRGHLYNWILNPENKFNKYLFIALSAISSIGYISKSAIDAIKNVTVTKENSKSELNLRKNLVEIEIENFKAKKLSAIKPLIDDFNYKLQQGKSNEELGQIAQNILIEIKNGPPYVYD